MNKWAALIPLEWSLQRLGVWRTQNRWRTCRISPRWCWGSTSARITPASLLGNASNCKRTDTEVSALASAWLTCPFSHLQVREAAPPPPLAAFCELRADRAAVLPQDHREHSHGETAVRHVQKLRPLPRNPCSILLVLKGDDIQTFASPSSSHIRDLACLLLFFLSSHFMIVTPWCLVLFAKPPDLIC